MANSYNDNCQINDKITMYCQLTIEWNNRLTRPKSDSNTYWISIRISRTTGIRNCMSELYIELKFVK